jgi:hypothetical protein
VIGRCEYFMADRGYDDTDLILWLKGKGVKSVIDKYDYSNRACYVTLIS